MSTEIIEDVIDRAVARPDELALIVQGHGLWQEVTRRELLEMVATRAGALDAFGLGGQPVVLACAGHLSSIVLDLALQAIGARPLLVPTDSDLTLLAELVATWEVRAAIVDSPEVGEQVAGATAGWGIDVHDDADLRRGADEPPEDGLRRSMMAAGRTEPALLGLSAGLVGRQRVVALQASRLSAAARTVVEQLGLVPADRVQLALPPDSLSDRVISIYAALASGASLAIADRALFNTTRREIAPTFLHLTPRVAQGIVDQIDAELERTRGLKRRAVRSWQWASTGQGRASAALRALLRVAVGSRIASKEGLHRLRYLLVSGGVVSDQARRLLDSLDVDLQAGLTVADLPGLAMVGPVAADGVAYGPVAGVGASIDSDRQLVLQGAGQEPIETGDHVELAGDRYRLRGRGDRRLSLARSEDIYAEEVETRLCSSAFVRSAVADCTDGLLHLVIEPSMPRLYQWAHDHKLVLAVDGQLLRDGDVVALFESEVRNALAGLFGDPSDEGGWPAAVLHLMADASRGGSSTTSSILRPCRVLDELGLGTPGDCQPTASDR